jgi:hypothetical protein
MSLMMFLRKRLKISAVFSMVAALLLLQAMPFMLVPASAKMRYYSNVSSNDFPTALKNQLTTTQQTWQQGFIDVTQAPYSAKGDGTTDDSDAIQAAINDGYDNNLAVFFPGDKTYLVSKQLILLQINDNWFHPSSKTWLSQRKFGHILVGSTTGTNRPIIKLANSSTVQDNILFLFEFYTPAGSPPADGLPGIRHRDIATWYDGTGTTASGSHYLSTMRGIDIDMGNNPTVNAISMKGAQHTALEDISISGTAFNAGLYNIPGSGGGVINVKVTGGKIGVYQNEYRPNPTLTGLELNNQSDYGIQLLNARGPLTVTGFKIVSPTTPQASYRAIYASNTSSTNPFNANLDLVDGTIEVTGTGGKAIYNYDQDVVMNNVYVKAATIIESGIRNTPTDSVAGDSSAWKKVQEYAFASGTDNGFIHVDGTEYAHSSADYQYPISMTNETPVGDMIAEHIWGTMPTWESNIVDITASPYNATRDNDTDDDASAIQQAIDNTTNSSNADYGKTVFIPRGHFHIKSTITLKKGAKMIGAGKNISVIELADDWLPTGPTVAVDTVNESDAGIILSDFAIVGNDPSDSEGFQNQKYLTFLRIRGGETIMRDVQTDRKENTQDSYYDQPTVVFSDNAGGKIYDMASDNSTRTATSGVVTANYRHLLIENTFNPLAFYQISVEYSDGTPQTEINASSNVTIYGYKYESSTRTVLNELLNIKNSHNITILGGSGNYTLTSSAQMITIDDSDGIYLANMSRTDSDTGKKWIVNKTGGVTTDSITADNPVVLYKTAAAAAPSLRDDFEDGNSTGWTEALGSGNWSVVTDGSTKVYKYTDGASSAKSYTGDSGWANYSIQAKIKVDSWNATGRAGVMARYTDSDNHYMMYYDKSNAQVRIVKRVGGTQTTLNTFAMSTPPSTGTYHTYELEMEGSTLNAYIDGLPAGTASDTSLTSGKVGLYSFNQISYFDDALVPLFEDHFEDGNSTGWTEELGSGNWSVVTDGSNEVYKYTDGASSAKSYAGDSSWTDYSVQAKIKVDSWNATGRAGVMARYADSDNHYMMYYDKSNAQVRIVKRVGGTQTTLNTFAMTAPSTGVYHTYELKVNGSTLSAYLDGSPTGTATDTDLTSGGKAGLYSFNQISYFDDAVVSVN